MSIISALLDYLKEYSGLETNAPVWVGYLGSRPTEYSVVALAGNKVVERYVNGGSMREFPFAFQASRSTADDAERLETDEFFEAFSDWLDAQTLAGSFPGLDAKKDVIRIEAVGWAYLMEQGNSETGIYSVICKISYIQQP